MRPVEVVKEGPPRSNKMKVHRLDGEYEWLEEWIPKVRLVAPWEGAEAQRFIEAVQAETFAFWQSRSGTGDAKGAR